MVEHTFAFELKESIARKMDKRAHKAATRWLRECRREIERLNPKVLGIEMSLHDLIIYGVR